MMDHFEILIHSILIRPDKPAVLLLGHFSPQTHQTHGFTGPDHWHNVVAQFYNVPHISIKSALFPDYMQDPKSVQKYFVDPSSPHLGDTCRVLPESDMYGLECSHLAVVQSRPSAHCRVRSRRRRRPWSIRWHWPTPRGLRARKGSSSGRRCRKEDGSYERPGRLLLFTLPLHHPLWPNHDPTKRELAIRRDCTILRFRQQRHQPLATVVVLRLGLVRAPPEREWGRCVDHGCTLLVFCAADEQA